MNGLNRRYGDREMAQWYHGISDYRTAFFLIQRMILIATFLRQIIQQPSIFPMICADNLTPLRSFSRALAWVPKDDYIQFCQELVKADLAARQSRTCYLLAKALCQVAELRRESPHDLISHVYRPLFEFLNDRNQRAYLAYGMKMEATRVLRSISRFTSSSPLTVLSFLRKSRGSA